MSVLTSIKRTLRTPLYIHGLARGIATLTGAGASIFALHRFSCPEEGVHDFDPAMLRKALSLLRKEHYELMSLVDIFQRLREAKPLKHAVAFTVDDGYFDCAEVAAPIFEEFDCPVTIFVASGFLDGKLWFWWDQIEFVVRNTRRSDLLVSVGGQKLKYTLDSVAARVEAASDVRDRCWKTPAADWLPFVTNLSRDADVEVPSVAPRQFRPLSWDKARQLEMHGVTFGPHTVTHPQLSSISDELSQWEIATSWQRLVDELTHPAPIFCYPFGRRCDFGEREMGYVGHLGLLGAVTAYLGKIQTGHACTKADLFRIQRFPIGDPLDILQCTSGLENVKARLRGIAAS
jgi:peptidoglycan/xylan/chitin deacetylase (PgdA/CDA1 family)